MKGTTMAITKSVIENFELANGMEIYVQSSRLGKQVSLSFDGNDTGYTIRLETEEALTLANKLLQVLREANEQ
jgi:hypothetical protein